MIKKGVDNEDMYRVILDMPRQLNRAIHISQDITVPKPDKIFTCGMGGSGIAGDILKSYMWGSDIPVFVIKDYVLPEYCGRNSLVFILSYSGNTEETVSAYRSALRKGCKIVTISCGGILKELCLKNKTPFVEITELNIQPRSAIAFLFIPLVTILQNSGILKKGTDISTMIDTLMRTDLRDRARELATKLKDQIPLIYTSTRLAPVGIRWKNDFDEDSKEMAFNNVLPEMDHNEIVGFTHLNGKYFAVFISDEDDIPGVRDRFKITKELISGKVGFTEVKLTGKNFLTKVFTAIMLGDLVGYYLAIDYGIDPTPVKVIEDLKKKLQEVRPHGTEIK